MSAAEPPRLEETPLATMPLATMPLAGAPGWAAGTPGGRGGQILRVTNLNASGPGSLRAALETEGPRIVVFEVAGVIDLERRSLHIQHPCVTVAGQTAPSPGITIIKGGLGIQTHDVILQHLRVRPGEAGAAKRSGWEVDAIATGSGAHDILIDHCSTSWATDENLSASGERFSGDSVEQWRAGTSHRVTISHCIIAEGLDDSTHGKGAHSKGSLIHDNATQIAADSPPCWPPALRSLPAGNVRQYVLDNAGARPWDRDAIDRRIVQQVRDGRGRIPDSEQEVGGYPDQPEVRRAFAPGRWDLSTMTPR